MIMTPASRLYLAGLAAALLAAPMQSGGQTLLVIPDLNPKGVVEVAGEGRTKKSATIQDVFFKWVPPISSEASQVFWEENQKALLPGSSIGLGTGRGALHTELGQVLSGAWRFSAGTTLAVAKDDSEETTDPADGETSSGFGRFVAGGGNLSLQGIRPFILANLGEHSGAALLFIPRAWLNVPELSSATGISDYGGEAAASVLFQRRDNKQNPFLTVEVRGGVVAGSTEFYETVGRTKHEKFAYVAPSLTFTLQDQVNIGVSTFISSAFKDAKTMTLRLTLRNKGGDPAELRQEREASAQRMAQ